MSEAPAVQTSFLSGAPVEAAPPTETPPAGATPPAAEQSTAAVPPQAAAGQTAATQTEAKPTTSGQAEATKPAPVEVKVPEGVEWSADVMAAIKAGDPQQLVDAIAKTQAQERSDYEKLTQMGGTWHEQLVNDPEIGGNKLVETQAHVQKLLTAFDKDQKFTKAIHVHGLGNNPDVVRFLREVSRKVLAEDTIAGTTNVAPPTKTLGQAFFGGVPGYEDLKP